MILLKVDIVFVKLFNYKNFDSFDRNDKYRLVDISARGCNRDGAAKSDLKHIRNTYTRKGVTFVAAAIDADKEYIHEIYGKNFLGISNLESMPAVFGRILQKEIIE